MKCAKCGKKEAKYKCALCERIYYCSIKCQNDDYVRHNNGKECFKSLYYNPEKEWYNSLDYN